MQQKTMLHYLSVCSGNSYDDLKILLNAIGAEKKLLIVTRLNCSES